MDRVGFHADVIKFAKQDLSNCVVELHKAYNARNEKLEVIRTFHNLLVETGVKVDKLYNLIDKPNHKKILYIEHRDKLPTQLAIDIRAFVYLSNIKIPKLKSDIEIYLAMLSIPDTLYFKLQRIANTIIANFVLLGGTYGFKQKLSYLRISNVKRKNQEPKVDWGESNKLKNKLIAEGHTVKSEENPDGVPWILYRTDDNYTFWHWVKNKVFIPDGKMYKFRAIATNNESTYYEDGTSVQDILNKPIGTYDKLMAILKTNPAMVERYKLET